MIKIKTHILKLAKYFLLFLGYVFEQRKVEGKWKYRPFLTITIRYKIT